LGAFAALRAANRAFRSNSSESAFGAFLRDFRCNPLRRVAAAQNRFAILSSSRTHVRAANLRMQIRCQPLLRMAALEPSQEIATGNFLGS
jgi:hypothetical protein